MSRAERWSILCDGAELAVECARVAADLEIAIEPEAAERPLLRGQERLAEGRAVAVLTSQATVPDDLVGLAAAAHSAGRIVPVGLLGAEPRLRNLAHDLGLPAVGEVRPLLAAVTLCASGASRPWTASARNLAAVDRARLGDAIEAADSRSLRLTSEDAGRLALTQRSSKPRLLGEARDVAEALRALRLADGASRPPMPRVEGVEPQPVLDVIFGPPRALSDPASKAALEPYDLPMPVEELCTSASRAAAEAGRIGFPVRIALASPDLRVRDHPDLVADGIDNAARVRDVFRQIMALAATRAPGARLLGVTVSATTPAHALLRVRVTPLPEGLALADVGFADPHGLTSDDRSLTVLPSPAGRLERALRRLRGRDLLFQGPAAERKQTLSAIADVLLRLAAFVHEWRQQVESVDVQPLALLVGGNVEVREVCVTVTDAFERSLDGPRDGSSAGSG